MLSVSFDKWPTDSRVDYSENQFPTLAAEIRAWCDDNLSNYRLTVKHVPRILSQLRKGVRNDHKIMVSILTISFERLPDYVMFRLRWMESQ